MTIPRLRLPNAFWTRLLWISVANWAWAVVVTQRVLEMHEGPPRMALILVGVATLSSFSNWAAARLSRSPFRHLPWLLVLGIAARHWHHHALRQKYEASAPVKSVGPAQSLARPITTTDVVLRYYALSSNHLSVERLRLILLTDLHVTPMLPRGYYERVFDLVAAQDADLILLSGDYVSQPANLELLASLFVRRWPARLGAFAVLGNHDIWTDSTRVSEILRNGGVRVVSGRCERLPETVGQVAVCGTEAPWGPELSTVLDRNALNLVLSHTPDNVYRLAEQGASLVFSGHTHGGQLRMPVLGSIVIPSRFGGLFDEGHFRVAGSDLFVSAGVGVDMPPLRVYCPPEIFVIDITRQ